MPDAAGFVPAARLRICYEKTDSHRHDGIGAGSLSQSTAPQEDSRLKEAYSACITPHKVRQKKLKPARAC